MHTNGREDGATLSTCHIHFNRKSTKLTARKILVLVLPPSLLTCIILDKSLNISGLLMTDLLEGTQSF